MTIIIILTIIKVFGILFDLRLNFRSARLNTLRTEDRIIYELPVALLIFQPDSIYCNVSKLAKTAKALEDNQIYTGRVLIRKIKMQIEKITISPIRRY